MRYLLLIAVFVVSCVSTEAQRRTPAAEFSGSTITGKQIELSSLRGKVILITFWSTRCPICNAEIPRLNRLAESYRGRDVVFIAPTADPEDKVRSYLQHSPFNFEIIPDSFGLMLRYAPPEADGTIRMGYPAYFLIGRDGSIEYQAMGWNRITAIGNSIDKLLAKRLAE